MTQSDAATLVAKLFAAWQFHRDRDELTAAVYVEQIGALPDFETALMTVNDLIEREQYLPSVARVREHYRAVAARQPKPLELDEAPLTEEQRATNLRLAREVLARYQAGKQDPGEGDVPWFDNALQDVFTPTEEATV